MPNNDGLPVERKAPDGGLILDFGRTKEVRPIRLTLGKIEEPASIKWVVEIPYVALLRLDGIVLGQITSKLAEPDQSVSALLRHLADLVQAIETYEEEGKGE